MTPVISASSSSSPTLVSLAGLKVRASDGAESGVWPSRRGLSEPSTDSSRPSQTVDNLDSCVGVCKRDIINTSNKLYFDFEGG